MAIGPCMFMACRSPLGTSFRGLFRLGADPEAGSAFHEVLLCPSHERECSELREKFPGRLMMTPEGHVYSGLWMDSLGFLSR